MNRRNFLKLAGGIVVPVLAGCDVRIDLGGEKKAIATAVPKPQPAPIPLVGFHEIPPEFRYSNWGGGSCVHASICTVLELQGRHDWAAWWRQKYRGGEHADGLARKMEAAGFDWAMTRSRTQAGMDWVRKTCVLGLYCAVNIPNGHMVTCNGFDDQFVYTIDNNNVRQQQKRTHAQFLRSWTGWAATVVFEGTPPSPVAF
jgi:hypothetical protein